MFARVTRGPQAAALAVLCAALLAGCAGAPAKRAPPEAARRAGPAAPAVIAASITLVAAGDNLIHREILDDAKTAAGGYDFEAAYAPVRALVRAADIAFVNQETLTAGPAFGYSGYPAFNGPFEIGDALERTGFDVVNLATNHALDKGAAALLRVVDFWRRYPRVLTLGVRDAPDEGPPPVVERRGIRVGFLSYTYGTNGIPSPPGMPYLVSRIDTRRMEIEIDRLRPLCDILVVSMHWGEEYRHEPTPRQIELARFLAARRVDLVIGHHPHVIQPVRSFDRSDGGKTLVFFSLGNFLSAQKEAPRMLGALARVTVSMERGADGPRAAISAAEIIPVVTHYEKGFIGFKVYPLADYTPELARRHGLAGSGGVSPAALRALFNSVFPALGTE